MDAKGKQPFRVRYGKGEIQREIVWPRNAHHCNSWRLSKQQQHRGVEKDYDTIEWFSWQILIYCSMDTTTERRSVQRFYEFVIKCIYLASTQNDTQLNQIYCEWPMNIRWYPTMHLLNSHTIINANNQRNYFYDISTRISQIGHNYFPVFNKLVLMGKKHWTFDHIAGVCLTKCILHQFVILLASIGEKNTR